MTTDPEFARLLVRDPQFAALWARARQELPVLLPAPRQLEIHLFDDLGRLQYPWHAEPQPIAGQAALEKNGWVVRLCPRACDERLSVSEVVVHEIVHILRLDVGRAGLSADEVFERERTTARLTQELLERWR